KDLVAEQAQVVVDPDEATRRADHLVLQAQVDRREERIRDEEQDDEERRGQQAPGQVPLVPGRGRAAPPADHPRLDEHVFTVVALVAAAGTQTPSAAEDKTLTIGVLGPLSGGAASYGVEMVRGAEMKADELNKAGGLKVGGDVYKIKLVSYDHKALAADAATA